MDMENKVRQIRELVEVKREKFARVSDEVWAVPELYFHETKSAAILIKALKEEGFEVQEGVDGIPTAFIGTWGSGKPVIGILGEFDALPSLSQEAGCWEHKEIVKGGPGHGCGHNALGAGAMAAAVAAKDYMEKNGLSGTSGTMAVRQRKPAGVRCSWPGTATLTIWMPAIPGTRV